MITQTQLMHDKKIVTAGRKATEAKKALIMVHGRGGSAEDILTLSNYLNVKDYALLAPQATGHTWYPYSFLMPPAKNEPWLSSALKLLKEVTDDVVADGIAREDIYFLGFSQGACLTLEFVTRNADRYGGVVAFTGGLIGDRVYSENYKGSFAGTPVFVGTSNPDPHVPVDRVRASEQIIREMGAEIRVDIYNNMGHTVSQQEIDSVNELIFNK